MLFSSPTSLTDALQSVQARAVLPTALSSAEIAREIPAQIRNVSFFSARTVYADYLSGFKREIETLVRPGDTTATRVSPLEIRARMRQALAATDYRPDPELRGGVQDLSSDRRIGLIIDTQERLAHGFGRWKEEQNPAILDLWPASELYSAEDRRRERDWLDRWTSARADLGTATRAIAGPPFVAPKNDPIWIAISRFGLPYPPFDFNSGMSLRDVRRDRAEELGAIAPDAPAPAPREQPLDALQETAVADLDPVVLQSLTQLLGATVTAGRLTLKRRSRRTEPANREA